MVVRLAVGVCACGWWWRFCLAVGGRWVRLCGANSWWQRESVCGGGAMWCVVVVLCGSSFPFLLFPRRVAVAMDLWRSPNLAAKPTKSVVVLLVHGFTAEGIVTWQFQVGSLTKKYSVYVPDLLFFCGSITDSSDRSPRFLAECLAKGLRKLGMRITQWLDLARRQWHKLKPSSDAVVGSHIDDENPGDLSGCLPLCAGFTSLSSSSNSLSFDSKFDFLEQFTPFKNFFNASSTLINSNERRKIAFGIAKMIKQEKGYLLQKLAYNFCPYILVEIMKMLEERQVAFAFFKFVFKDNLESVIWKSCIAAHLLAAEDLRFLAQDVLTWVIRRTGEDRSNEVVEFMWREHSKYESDFSVLNSLMRSFTNAEMGSQALDVLGRLRKTGSRPSLSAIISLLKLLLRVGDYGSVWKLFRDMVKRGPCPSVFIYNVMILGFCRRGCVSIGESLLHVMKKFRCEPDVYTYNILINAYCVRGWTSDALNWVRMMVESGCKPSTVTFGTVISAFCKDGNIVEARNIFDGMQEMGVLPNTVSYNTLMNGYVKAREVNQANMLYEEMRSKGVAPDSITFNILVAGHYKYGTEEDGDKILRDLSCNELIPDCSLSDISISGLCWSGRLEEALELLENMLEKGIPLSVVAFNSIITAYSEAGLEDKAFEVYNIMIKFGLTPSASTCTSLLIGLSKVGRLQEAMDLMIKMIKNGYPINKVAFTVVLDGYFKKGDMVGAQIVWEEMEKSGMAPDAVAFSAFINGLCKAGFVEEAYDAFLKMTRKGLVPNNFAYNSLISGFCNSGKLNEALKLEREMRQRGLLPDVFTINIIINGFCKQGRMKLATDTYMEMHKHGLTADIVTYNTLISGYCKAFDLINVDNFVNRMHASGWDPDITTYNIRLHGLCSSQRMNLAVMMFDDLISTGMVPNTVTYNTLMNGVCNDILDRAMILAAKLLKMGFVPNTVTTNVLLSHLIKQGLPQRAMMWGQKLSEISFDFDEVTYKILDRAYNDSQVDAEYTQKITGKIKFKLNRSKTQDLREIVMCVTILVSKFFEDYRCSFWEFLLNWIKLTNSNSISGSSHKKRAMPDDSTNG
ncbi:unnamed protein product [Fraxinus pennsylvanica]|uniref:Pentatricopeptide repeat-containing protein n=1 Tax=Fraxinus pennsylvanica TaxID=56036 RepID=A0AAD2DYH3_9LAMI|nr:unnamed protein product [Fraxinus pennsylvanica]